MEYGERLVRRNPPTLHQNSRLLMARMLLASGMLGFAWPVGAQNSGESKAHTGNGSVETQLEIVVTTQKGDKPVGNASVYVRFPDKSNTDKLTEMDLKTNEDGRVKVPRIPQGRIMIQVVAEGKKTFGEWFDVEEEQKTIRIRLEPPAHWY
jgi:hypothetical protein